jgi:hypothetical protein
VLKRVKGVVAATLASGAISACAFFGGGSLTDKATRAERLQCEGATGQDELSIVQTTRVVEAEGKYSNDGNGISKVIATRIVLRPPAGVTADKMTRILQCHNARVVLERVDAARLPNDPYSLPDTWIDIDVKEEEGNYVVVIGADRVADNIRVLQRAKAFAAAQSAASAPKVQSGPAPAPIAN